MKNKVLASLLMIICLAFSIATEAQIRNTTPRDAVYDKQHMADNSPIPYPYVREADVVWAKRVWRMIDLREKMNQPFYYPEVAQKDWRSLVTVLMDALKEGNVTAYDASAPTDEFLVPLNYKELIKRMQRIDTLRLQRPYPPYASYDTIIRKEFRSSDIKRFRIKEDWFFDKQRSVMEVRILGICPVRDSYDERGEFRGYEPLFWVYFPEARPVLAKAEVFNRRNDAQRLSYDDVFMRRLFASVVYKENNEFDRQIGDYATGLDALLESERIKKEIFMWESDLWQY